MKTKKEIRKNEESVQRGKERCFPMIKLFISQPMNGIDDDVVLKKREEAITNAKKFIKSNTGEDEVEALETFIYEDAPEDAGRLWYLGRSIQMLGKADYIYFVEGYENANGCMAEEYIAKQYGINLIYEKDLNTLYKLKDELERLGKKYTFDFNYNNEKLSPYPKESIQKILPNDIKIDFEEDTDKNILHGILSSRSNSLFLESWKESAIDHAPLNYDELFSYGSDIMKQELAFLDSLDLLPYIGYCSPSLIMNVIYDENNNTYCKNVLNDDDMFNDISEDEFIDYLEARYDGLRFRSKVVKTIDIKLPPKGKE